MSNTAPVITTSSDSLGTKTNSFDIVYTVTDADSDEVTAVYKLDGTQFATSNDITLGDEVTLTIENTALAEMSSGSHTITIEVSDGTDISTKNITFTRGANIFTDRPVTLSKQNLVDLTAEILEAFENYIPSGSGEGSGSGTSTDLSNYYTKSEVNSMVALIPTFDIEVVQSLPSSNISETTVYLLASASALSQNSYTEYIYVNNNWEKLGEGTVDLSGYYTSTNVNSLLGLDAYSTSATYAIGDYAIYNNTIYKCKTAISEGEEFTAAKWDATTIEAEIAANKILIDPSSTDNLPDGTFWVETSSSGGGE